MQGLPWQIEGSMVMRGGAAINGLPFKARTEAASPENQILTQPGEETASLTFPATSDKLRWALD